MIRNPMLDMFTGAVMAMGGPLALMLPQRIFVEMLANAHTPPRRHDPEESTATGSGRTAV